MIGRREIGFAGTKADNRFTGCFEGLCLCVDCEGYGFGYCDNALRQAIHVIESYGLTLATMNEPVILRAKGLLFDLDGVLVDSTESVERHWRTFAARYGVDPDLLVTRIHGYPAPSIIKRELAGRSDEVGAAIKWHADLEESDASGCTPAPGAVERLADLPKDGWAIVTSCHMELAVGRATAAGVELPRILVTADQLEHGKPAPDGYLAGAERLGLDPADCVVFEDAATGMEAGLAAGATVVALRTTTPDEKLAAAHHIVDDLRNVKINPLAGGFELVLSLSTAGSPG